MKSDLSTIRNIGIAAHIDAGKTTTTERVLFYTGQVHRMGEVDHGTTTTDFDEQEQKRGITIFSAAVSCPWRDHTINLIDTPGHVDFTAEVERSLRVLDGMVAVFDAKEGVEAQSETVWRQADRYHVPRICFMNKMDRIGADFENAVQSIRDRLGAHLLVLQTPIGAGPDFVGLVDLIEMKALCFEPEAMGAKITESAIPDAMMESCELLHQEILEVVAETSDARMEKFLADETFTSAQIHEAIREATICRDLVPVLCGSSLRYIGVQRMLDAVIHYLPSPLDVPPIIARDPKIADVTHTLHCNPSDAFAGLIFKIVAEKPVDLYYIRIYSGTLKASSRVQNSSTGDKENITRIFRMFAKRRDQLDEAKAGDIVAIVGPKHALTGHTFSDPRRPVLLESIDFPETVISVAIEPVSAKDRDKLMLSLRSLVRQDPTLSVTTNEETGQTLLSGMGELHLEVMVQRLRADLNVEARVGKPRVSFRETVSQSAIGQGQFERNVGGRDHFASLRLDLRHMPTGSGEGEPLVSWTADRSGLLPEYVKAIEQGIADASQSGILGGYPVIDWHVDVLDYVKNDQTNSELSFENAARIAFYHAMELATPKLLQPIMAVEVVTSDDYFGQIMADLNSRGAEVRKTDIRGSERVISADVPLSQMFGYVTRLRSLSQGRATSTMKPSHYAPVSDVETKSLVG